MKKSVISLIAILALSFAWSGWALEPIPTIDGHYQRINPKDDATIDLKKLTHDSVNVDAMAFWKGSGLGQIHSGEVKEPCAYDATKNVVTYHTEGCKIIMKLDATFQTINVDEIGTCGGLNVTFKGQYQRRGPSKQK